MPRLRTASSWRNNVHLQLRAAAARAVRCVRHGRVARSQDLKWLKCTLHQGRIAVSRTCIIRVYTRTTRSHVAVARVSNTRRTHVPSHSAQFPIAEDFSLACLRFSTRQRQFPIDCFSNHPGRKPLRSYANQLIGWIGVAVDAVLRPLDHRVDDWLRRRKLHVGHPHRDDAAQPRKKESRACPPVRALRESVPAQSSTADGSGGSGIGMCGRQADEALEPRAGWTQQKDAAGHTPISGTRN